MNKVFCQTSVLSLKTWSWLCFTPVTRRPRTRITPHQISQLLMTRFWPNFKRRLLRTSRTDSNCYGDICQGNICPCNICPYQKYISCYWSDFDQTFWTQFLGAFFGPRNLLYPKLFDLNSFWPNFFLTKFFSTNFLDLSFLTLASCT